MFCDKHQREHTGIGSLVFCPECEVENAQVVFIRIPLPAMALPEKFTITKIVGPAEIIYSSQEAAEADAQRGGIICRAELTAELAASLTWERSRAYLTAEPQLTLTPVL